jgi:NADPH-dependent 2,4-dienoyl-CoA reductase/sulfur reductase-like enzyme
MPERIVVVGTGAAGLRAAERLRELDFAGELVMVSEERYRPYHRPALTKQLLTGEVRPRDIVLPVHTDLDATWRYGVRARYLEPQEHILHLPGGEEIQYDGLVIATGCEARHLPGAPRHDPRVHVLRSVADGVGIQKAIANGRGAVVVVGGGFVGCEIASAARTMGRDAVIIAREDRLLDKVPGPGFGETVTELHRSNGVQLITGVSVRHWVPRADGIALHLSDGRVVVAGCVVLGVGGIPSTDWLRGSGLIIDDGIMCDATTHAVGAEDIVVAGDVARWPNLLFDTVPRRVEHWLNAIEMGRTAAANLLLGRQSAKPFMPLPRFWSDQHGVKIQAAGLPALAQETVPLAGSVRVGHRVTGFVSNGLLVGVVAWDSPRGMLRWSAELDSQLEKAASRQPTRRYRTTPDGAPAERDVVELHGTPAQRAATRQRGAAPDPRGVVELETTPAQLDAMERRRAPAARPVADLRVPELRAPEMRIPPPPPARPPAPVPPPPAQVTRPPAPPARPPAQVTPPPVQVAPPPAQVAPPPARPPAHFTPPPVRAPLPQPPAPVRAAAAPPVKRVQPPPEVVAMAADTQELHLPELRVDDASTTELYLPDLHVPDDLRVPDLGEPEPVYNRTNGTSGYFEPVEPPPPNNRFNGFSGYFEPAQAPAAAPGYEGRHGRDPAETSVAQLRAVMS